MNFHKTIGFLATLLLVVGLGAPDSFAQNPTVKVSDVSPSTLREGQARAVTVEVELSAAPGAGNTVTVDVALPSSFPTGSHLVASHDVAGTATPGFPDVVIIGTATKGTSISAVTATEDDNGDTTDDTNYNHPRDKKVSFTVTASGHDAATDNEMLTVREDDGAIGPLTLSIDPPSADAAATDVTTVTLKVTLDKAPGTEDADNDPNTAETPVTVTANITAEKIEADGTTVTISGITAVSIENAETSGTTDVAVPASSTVGEFKVMAIAVGYEAGEISIPVIERDADDVTGYRVLLTAPGANAWKGIAKRAVTVEVVRADRIAYPWTEFSSIAVSLADTLVTDGATPPNPIAIYTLTASGFSKSNGELTFSRARAENTVTPAPAFGNNADANEITYDEGADKLIFKFQTKAATGGSGEPLGDIPDANDRNDEDEAGQRTAIYAYATFSTGGTAVATLSNRSQKNITSTSTVKVGNGRLIKLDFRVPTAAERNEIFPSAPVVTIEGETIDSGGSSTGKKGDVIRVAVKRSDERPRDERAQIIIQSIANSDVIGSAKSLGLQTWNFTTLDLIDAAGDSLIVSIKVEDLNAQNTQNPRDPGVGKDGQETTKNSKYEPDNLQMEARVRIRDQALNNSGVLKSDQFRADPRAPEISVLHPTSDSPHFSGRNRNTIDIESVGINFDDHLRPLELRADEALDSLFVYIKGATYYMNKDDERVDMRLNLLDEDAERGAVTKAFDRPTYFVEDFGDTTSYDTRGLMWKNAKGEAKATGQGGRTVDLVIDAYDKVGNKTSITLSGVHHDEVVPTITDWFPKNKLLDDNTINNVTRHPNITLKEAVDSLSVTYGPSSGAEIVVEEVDVAEGDHGVAITEDFEANKTYTLTIFARDLAGNIFITDEDEAKDMKFDASFPNPIANMFKLTNKTAITETNDTATDSVVAGQSFVVDIQAIDKDSDDSRKVVTYRNDDALDVILMAVNEDDEVVSSVRFSGKEGVTDNENGTASLDAANWALGKRRIEVKSNMTVDNFTVKVQHRMAGDDGTAAVSFEGELDGLTVDAADFQMIELTAWEEGEDDAVSWVWEDFGLRMVPTDRYGNPSVKTYLTDPDGVADTLKILDTRIAKGNRYPDGVDIRLQATPAVEGLLSEVWGVGEEGYTLSVTAPDKRGSSLVIQARVLSSSLHGGDDRSENRRGSLNLRITPNLMPSITVWDSEGNDVTGQEIEIPAGGSTTVTARAEGFMAGSSVTFTKDGETADTKTADDAGQATLSVTMSAEGSVEISAASGQDAADAISIVFVKETRKPYEDAEGNPVYLVYTGDAPPDMTVDDNDFQAFSAAYPSSEGDDNYNVLADIDGDGDVDLEDFNLFALTWGRTAINGPSSKPLVLLPGINENAEFSLRLGSERVIPGELIDLDVALANVQALVGYGFVVHYDAVRFEFVSAAPAAEDLLKSTGAETPLFQHWATDGQIRIANSVINGTAVSGGGDIVRLTFRVLQEFEENARFEIADGLVFDPQQLSNLAVVAGVLELQSTPMEFALHQNFPNPFNPDTTIKYELAESADVTLQIYNVLGQVVRTLVVSESQPPGRYQIRWNGMDDRGVSVSSGVYFYKISAEGKFHDVRKLMLLK